MSQGGPLVELRQHIEWVYQQILLRPQVICQMGSLEAVVLALEDVLDKLSDNPDRPGSYRRYLGSCGFGMSTFQARFEKERSCVLTFVACAPDLPPDESVRIREEYTTVFTQHWQSYLEWRSSDLLHRG
jgi:hypothetical protein